MSDLFKDMDLKTTTKDSGFVLKDSQRPMTRAKDNIPAQKSLNLTSSIDIVE